MVDSYFRVFSDSFDLASYRFIWDCRWSGHTQYPGINQGCFYCAHKRGFNPSWKHFA